VSGEGFIAEKRPYAIEAEEGKTYYWCSCGRSHRQPYCDGSHAGTSKIALAYKAGRSEKVNLCGCKQSRNPPLCDGSHNIV
jgi:CDGSH-type Zn-finger protein